MLFQGAVLPLKIRGQNFEFGGMIQVNSGFSSPPQIHTMNQSGKLQDVVQYIQITACF